MMREITEKIKVSRKIPPQKETLTSEPDDTNQCHWSSSQFCGYDFLLFTTSSVCSLNLHLLLLFVVTLLCSRCESEVSVEPEQQHQQKPPRDKWSWGNTTNTEVRLFCSREETSDLKHRTPAYDLETVYWRKQPETSWTVFTGAKSDQFFVFPVYCCYWLNFNPWIIDVTDVQWWIKQTLQGKCCFKRQRSTETLLSNLRTQLRKWFFIIKKNKSHTFIWCTLKQSK